MPFDNDNDLGPDDALKAEERAYKLLQWGYPAPLAPFDEALACDGFYSRIQKERSDKALDAFDAEKESQKTLSELDAFRELCRLGVLTDQDLFSPDKAQRRPRWIDPQFPSKGDRPTTTSYTDDLKQFKSRRTENNKGSNQRTGGTPGGSTAGIQPARLQDCDQGRPSTERTSERSRNGRFNRNTGRRQA